MSIPTPFNPLGHRREQLPPGFKRAEYLRSDGGQAIDTGLLADTLSRVMLDVQFFGTSGDRWNGAQNSTTNYRFAIFTSGAVTVRGAVGLKYSDAVAVGNDRVVVELAPSEFKVDGVSYAIAGGTPPHDNFFLFGRNFDWAPGGSPQKLFAFKAWKADGSLVCDMVPAVRKSDSRPCMVDLLAGTPFFNRRTGEFTTNFNE